MKIFKFEIEVKGIFGNYNEVVYHRGNHLQGAIRQIYQNRNDLVRIVRILAD